ncbi:MULTISPECIES: glycolate oxidase subunit GlcE [unclassified Polynucleobacter]|uniref:glycolate oxidase subunit GlcE n=1 Tax=unclassified Polynucleobacter TaxID=2640945 RepID=UPI002572796B|nr:MULTISPECIES: glycolate oxidase subunit GlcE [unclassified Polynucleobacter]BEI43302.1 glycolate oxidase subunit GlcE [Polynucleobacter sp. HIN10]BEI45078.1 glycolate oxidase subunit GlcE [Polynucleobacter sp. HIN11]
MNETVLSQFREQIIEAGKQNQVLSIQGGNTKSWYGNPNQSPILSTKPYQGILDYQPEELVITACAGTPIAEIESTLAKNNQILPFEPPHFGEDATFGGVIAAGLAGPARISSGNLRDFVLGTRLMDGRGEDLSFGGKVMKNVAGYDVSRLLPGSLGTLALLLEASVKVLPKPAATASLRCKTGAANALKVLNEWAGQPLPLNASVWIGHAGDEGELTIRLAGAKAAATSASQMIQDRLGATVLDDLEADLFWRNLREQQLSWFTQMPNHHALWRLSLPANCPVLEIPKDCSPAIMMEWHGQERWIQGPANQSTANVLQKLALQHGGHATCFRSLNADGFERFTCLESNPLTAGLEAVQKRLRHSFDPFGVFTTGRLP